MHQIPSSHPPLFSGDRPVEYDVRLDEMLEMMRKLKISSVSQLHTLLLDTEEMFPFISWRPGVSIKKSKMVTAKGMLCKRLKKPTGLPGAYSIT